MRKTGNKRTISIAFILIAGIIVLPILLSNSYAELDKMNPTSLPDPIAKESASIIDAVHSVQFFCVVDGEIKTCSFRGADLAEGKQLQVDGYVCGITVSCKNAIDITLDGTPLKRTHRRENLLFWPEIPNDAGYEAKGAPACRNVEDACPAICDPEQCSSTCYSLFPRVKGDALSQEPEIDLVFRNAVGAHGLTIRQQPSRTVTRNSADWTFTTDRIEFLGSTQDRMRAQATDFEKRLNAVEYGVEFVESAVGSKLVKDIKIVDCSSPRGAVSCDQSADIWVYANTFLDESVDELSVISSHEALHVLVERFRLARDSEVRELFARLWGYDEFSRERFAIVTAGIAPPADPLKVPQDGIFFAFISEHNFLDSMKGGHAQTGTEEFCVSFLHSLLYLDRLQQNLEQPLRPADEAECEPRALSTNEKEKIISDYLAGIETLLQALPEGDEASLSLKCFLQERRGEITDRFVGKTMPPA